MRSTTTVSQIIADARMLAGARDYNFPTQISMLSKYNFAMSQIYKLLNGARLAKFMAHFPIGTPPSALISPASAGKSYTAATKKITHASVTTAYRGGIVMFSDATNVYFAYITAVTANTDFTVSDGPAGNISNVIYIAFAPPTTTSHSLDGLRVDTIRRVQFPLSGNAARVNPDVFESLASDPNYASASAITHTGTGSVPTVGVFAGSSTVNKGGYPVLFFTEKPRVATAVTENCDLPIEYHAPLTEEIARQALLEIGSKVPKALENPFGTLGVISESYDATRQAFAQSTDTP